ncbi:MAG: adenylate/guanylate cyclase domain-containing protein [Desulfobacteraceae bacterium]|nr:MAG: adenylate/guanylate cyclase domain-containing protein [Desulfobacteraceae bacterium]
MNTQTDTLAVLFADIAKSTAIYETLGDQRAQTLIESCLTLLKKVTGKFNGVVIKTIGDELMCTFPTARDAVSAAKEMNQTLTLASVVDDPACRPPNIYVGIHYGPVILEKGDVFGDTVNVAARIAGFKKQRQILISEQTADALPPDLRSSVKCVDHTTIKGKTGEFTVYEFIWEAQDLTIIVSQPMESLFSREQPAKLELVFHSQTVTIGPEKHGVSLGRQTHNDIVIDTQYASRSHARIEYRRGKFFLMDQSSNGTYILYPATGDTFHIRQEEIQLNGSGIICPGRQPEANRPDTLSFRLLQA